MSSSTPTKPFRCGEKLTAWLRIYQAEEPIAAEFRAQQVRAMLRLTPLTMLANLFNVGIVLFSFANQSNILLLLIWSICVMCSSAAGVRNWLRTRRGRGPKYASIRVIASANKHATILALIWATLPLMLFQHSHAHVELVLTAICTGMICAGGFALTTIPTAAFMYVFILTGGCLAALLLHSPLANLDLVLLLSIYAFIVIASITSSARAFGARLMAEAEAARQQQLVGLLLNDFESHASDWLWEIDERGHLCRVSNRLTKLFGLTKLELSTRPFISLFAVHYPETRSNDPVPLDELRQRLVGDTPFRELVLPVVVSGERRWWALTAKPLFNHNGKRIGWRGVGSDITHRRRADLEMQRLANFDSLTGLANRHQFHLQLAMVNSGISEHDRHCALLFMDLDNFKNINDSLGHGAGDRVLQIVAQHLQTQVRRGDLLARLGGDEFAILSWVTGTMDQAREQVGTLAQNLLHCLRAPIQINGVNVQIGSSIGIAIAPQNGTHTEVLLQNADMALYAAKSCGRGTYCFFEPDMTARAQYRLSMLNELRQAIETDVQASHSGADKVNSTWQFKLRYQPQMNLQNHEIKGFEALVCWQHPQRGLLGPHEFIALAEESNLIIPLGTWILTAACHEAMRWNNQRRIAVNVSAVQFAQDDFVETVRTVLRVTGLPSHRLELEITESLLIHDRDAARDTMITLQKLGVRIALDDFGTGYSSLSYLRSFPLNKLKIDRTFVTSLNGDTDAKAIMRAIIDLAEALGLETTAEGVERQSEVQLLRARGCTDVQGFLIAKPMSAAEIDQFDADWKQRRTELVRYQEEFVLSPTSSMFTSAFSSASLH